MPKELDFAELQQEARLFRNQFQTVILSTSSSDSTSVASYAPFVLDDSDTPYIFVSRLAQHTQNLLIKPSLSLLFIADEKTAKNLFARQRLTLQCQAKEILRDSEVGIDILEQFKKTFGKMATLLQSLGDFHLFRLEVSAGNYIRGFGQAYSIADASLSIVQQNRG
jgi:putative heme iron utilization protein